MMKENKVTHAMNELTKRQLQIAPFYTNNIRVNPQKKVLPEILFITSFPPRECGIATYSQDLVKALSNQFENSFNFSICALETATNQYVYKQSPKYVLNTNEPNSYLKTAFRINGDANIKIVVFQHEFGFFADQENEFNQLYSKISKPLVFVFHTVLPQPDSAMKNKVQEMVKAAKYIIVMTENAAEILREDFDAPSNKIKVIPHGTHLVAPLNRKKLKKKYELSHRTVLSTFGLLSSSKSIETTLNALPDVIKKHPKVIFLILGKTHPSIVQNEGEKYREMLEAKVKELHLQKNVRFVNEYTKIPTLLDYLQLTDIYLFTSKDPNQAVSGTLSYAISCGCPVVSTPIPHAKEILNGNNGIVVDFENAKQLSEAILLLLENKDLRKEIASNSLHKMAPTAWQNSAIAHSLLFSELTQKDFKLSYKAPKINLKHIQKMTTNFGMLQFSKIAVPDRQSGYTLDDNARALIAICQHFELTRDKTNFARIDIYLQFINFCLQPNGLFLNYVNTKKSFTAANFNENLEDSNGRAIWALGYVVSLKNSLPIHFVRTAEKLLDQALVFVENIYSPRSMAFIIKGLYYRGKKRDTKLLQILASRLVRMYQHEKSTDWHWFESYMTYANSILSEALLCAYLVTSRPEYKKIAHESFDFLLDQIFVNGQIKVVSNKGWHLKNSKVEAPIGGEQPIDVAYTILTLEKFYSVFKTDSYRVKITQAFNWFLGDNHLHQIVYNPTTGGCYDGVEQHNVNLNQGAESTISYLLARLALERVSASEKIVQYNTNQKPQLLINQLEIIC